MSTARLSQTTPSPAYERAPAPADPLPMDARGITKHWPKAPAPVLDDVDVVVAPGRSVWVGGRNGAGKTTLFRILAGLIDPDAGDVRAYGYHPFRQRREYQRRVHFLSAGNSGVYARLTVRGQLDCWARMALIPRAERAAAVARTLEECALEELANHRSDRLSMGQRQRVKIALTFVATPDVVLLDEPRNSLDAEGAAILRNAIQATLDRGGSVLWCSPTGETIDFDFDERYILEGGKLRPE